MSGENQGPDLFFAGGECLDRFGVWVRRTDVDLEEATREVQTRNSDATAIGRDGIIRVWDPDKTRAEWLNEEDLDATRNVAESTRTHASPWTFTRSLLGSQPRTIAPNGELEAHRLVEDTSSNSHLTRQAIGKASATQSFTLSVYIRPDERNGARLILSDAAVADAAIVDFDDIRGLEAGQEQTTGAGWAIVSTSIERAGYGFFRLAIAVTTDASEELSVTLYLRDGSGSNSYQGDGVSGYFFWGLQVEQGAVATDPQLTPREIDRRFPSLLLEAEVTNGFTQSEEFQQADWTKTRLTVAADVRTAPDGTFTADTIREDLDVNTSHRISQGVGGLTAGVDQGISVYVQKLSGGIRDWFSITTNYPAQERTFFNIRTGEIGTQAAGHKARIDRIDVPGVDLPWFRCSVVANTGAQTSGTNEFNICIADDDVNYDGDGTSGFAIWGAQHDEDFGGASSYVKSGGVSATRLPDTLFGPYPHPPQAMTVYAKWRDDGRTENRTSRVWQISGVSSGAGPRFLMRETGAQGVTAQYDDGTITATSSPTIVGTLNPGDIVEVVVTLTADGVITATDFVINGRLETPGPPAAGGPLPAAWIDQRFYINSGGTTNIKVAAYLALKAHRGVRTLAFMRAL